MAKHGLSIFAILICGLGLLVPGVVAAAQKIPALANVSTELPEAEQEVFRQRKLDLEATYREFKVASDVFTAKAAKDQTDAEYDSLMARRAQYIASVQKYNSEMASRVKVETGEVIARLAAQEKTLTQAIERDLTAVQNLGFDRRAQDFEEWEKLAANAQREFENSVSAELTGLIAFKVKGGIITGVKNLDQAKVGRWIAALMKQDPPPVEIIAVLQRLAVVGDHDRIKLATDAKYLAKLIENVAKGAKVVGWEDSLPVLLDIVCEAFPAEAGACKLFKATATVTVASVYNYATRRVADAEIERLTSLTESELKALANLNGLLIKHVTERRETRSRLNELVQ
jgi:hypothetical protein